ncbi:WbuC family cupin fold metalloprotein [Yersinia ruckeri]|uniref:WbuC family cupin fold metalloprotein n=1 Tax=Yersinia ruckeri TaxID=29486 RepID=UPI0020C13E80|nr:WbuC family cupin fold metalloprotein [Yersinia ruckeri]EKN4183860.1 WbuC family cupin fold metalloprotein [Yersinia ruckeri]EKN4696654.1 WbuC family cupin fold metalloprotein [Yersinia ruckeri]MCK8554949.1 WbuC family cupin fold metalloprotein [Yersinia ruckeri]MCW6625735.1 WbuC family cupin fold metalloprotein [Yersinia ruckeri]
MKYTIFSNKEAELLIEKAYCSARLRTHCNLHHSYLEPVQRVVIALLHGTYIPPHYHSNDNQWEFFQVLKGIVDLFIFDDEGNVSDIIPLGDNSSNYFVEIKPRTCHTLVCRSDSAILVEVKQGPFDINNAKIVPEWSFPEEYGLIRRDIIITSLENMNIGDKFSILSYPSSND